MRWLLIPGWSTTPSIFNPYIDLFEKHINYHWAFQSGEIASDDSRLLKSITRDYSILCYSMGVLKALEFSKINPPQRIISIGGFSSFCDNDKRRKMHVNLMLRGLKKDPKRILNDFYSSASLHNSKNKNWNIENLEKGLITLRDCDFSTFCNSSNLDILLIEGKKDGIVPQDISHKLLDGPGNRRSYELEGGHGIIETNINDIKQIISDNL